MMKKLAAILLFASCMVMGGRLLAQEDDEPLEGRHYFVNLSLYYPISINRSPYDGANLNLSLVYGKVGRVEGLDLSLVASVVTRELIGLQVCGLMGVVGELGTGAQISGLMNVCGEDFKGAQISGLMNIAGEGATGLQASGLMNVAGRNGALFQSAGLANIVGEEFKGVQSSGLFNVAGENGRGLQASGLFNVTGEDFKGLQAAGLFNVTGGMLNGLQAAPFNVAAESVGVQVGLANVAGSSRGIQIGLVNYTHDENTGVPIGPVNLAANGHVSYILWAGNTTAAAAGVRFTVGRVYSMVSLGAFNLDDGIAGSLTYGCHYGIWIPAGRLNLNADVGYRFRDNESVFRFRKLDPDQHMLEARLLLELPIGETVSLIFGGGAGIVVDCGTPLDSGRTKPLFVGGIEFY